MRKVKPLSEYQKGIYGEILGEFFNPIFSTIKSRFINLDRLFLCLIRLAFLDNFALEIEQIFSVVQIVTKNYILYKKVNAFILYDDFVISINGSKAGQNLNS